MFDIGLFEILIICVVLLFVVGPRQIPRVAFTAGRWIKYLRNTFNAASEEINQQIQTEFSAEYQQKESEKLLQEEKND